MSNANKPMKCQSVICLFSNIEHKTRLKVVILVFCDKNSWNLMYCLKSGFISSFKIIYWKEEFFKDLCFILHNETRKASFIGSNKIDFYVLVVPERIHLRR